jgi:TetR/AcrR family transcriptional repressor of mexJK operon
VYSHYGAKENLFLLVLRQTYEVMRDRISAIVNRTLRQVDDVEESLTSCVRDTVRTMTRAPERSTLVRLIISEAPHFPDVIDLWHNGGIVPLIAEPLARLAAAGRLAIDDPAQAADQLYALTFGQVNTKSMMGTIRLTDTEAERIITNGAHAPAAPTRLPRHPPKPAAGVAGGSGRPAPPCRPS